MTSVIGALLNSLWQAAALALCVWMLLRWLPRVNAATRHAVWWAVLAVVVALPIARAPMERIWTRPATPLPLAPQAGDTPPATSRPTPLAPAAEVPLVAARPAATPARTSPPAAVELDDDDWVEIVAVIWVAVMLAQLARLAGSFFFVRRLKRRAIPAPPALDQCFQSWMTSCRVRRRVRLLVSADIRSPMAVGFFKPVVLLPEALLANFQQDELDHILLHELAHLARRDDWTNLAARFAAAFVILHPLAAWVLRRIDRERELACDEWVVSVTGQARPYAQSLARLFELCRSRRRVLLATGMAGRRSQLGGRIEALLRRRDFAPKASRGKVFMSVLALAIFVLAASETPRWVTFARDAQPAPREYDVQPEPQGTAPGRSESARPNRAAAAQAPMSQAPAPRPVIPPGPPPAGGFLASLVAAGYVDLSVDEIIELKNNGVSGEFIVEMSRSGWGKLAPRQLIDLRNNGVRAEYAAEMLDAEIRELKIQDLIQLRQHGVQPEFALKAHALGFGPFDARELAELTSQGVRTEMLQALKEAGFKKASLREVIDAQHAGLRASHFSEAKQFSSSLSLQQVIRLKHAGVLK